MPDRPLDSFSDELMQMLMASSKQEVIVPVANKSMAVSLRYRLYHLRAKLIASKDPTKQAYVRAQFTILRNGEIYHHSVPNQPPPKPTDQFSVRGQPADADINPFITKALANMGLTPGQAPDISGISSLIEDVKELPDDFIPDDEPEVENNA